MTGDTRGAHLRCWAPFAAVMVLLLAAPVSTSSAWAQAAWGIGADSYRIHNRVTPDSCVVDDQETVVRYRKEPLGEAPDSCVPAMTQEAETVKSVVKAYWAASAKDQYRMFSAAYREMLARVHDVSGPDDYATRIDPERIYVRQVYQRVELGTTAARVTVLAAWTQEGYEGVQTYIFELVREGDTWRIADLYY